MTTSDKYTEPDPQDPKKKGGGDGDAKSAVPKPTGKRHDETSSSEEPPESDVRSRKITSSGT